MFGTDKRPWIQPDNADALLPWSHATARPGRFTTRLPVDEAGEVGDDKTQITPRPDGPLMLRGRLEIETPDGTLHETRAALCRCGRSGNKPLCDGMRTQVGWRG